jgi:subtilisin family serine protease
VDQGDPTNGIFYILDSGLEPLHCDQTTDEFYGRVVDEWFSSSNSYGDVVDRQGHGTFMAGVAAANINSGVGHGGTHGIAGVAGGWYYDGPPGPGLGICVVGVTAPIETWCIEALDYVLSQAPFARVVSCSWSSTDNPALLDAIENCFLVDISIFFSSGIASTPQPNSINYPALWAKYDICSAVGTIDSVGIRADFSCYGPELSFVAPGDSIWSTTNTSNGFYTYGSGTSPSTAYAAGVVALIYQKTLVKGWDLIDVDMKRIMELSSRHNDCIYGSAPDVETGYGCINA